MKYRKKDSTNNRDYISNLPNDVISNILSRLLTKYAVQTYVLSKAWEYKWNSIYNISISESWRCGRDGHALTFVNFVDRILYGVQNVRCFNFYSGSRSLKEYENNRMQTWLYTVFRRNVEEVTVETNHTINLPRSFSTCTALRELQMHMTCTWKTPINSYFPNLTCLKLLLVEIMNENSNSDTLVFHFPVLKEFEIGFHQWSNVRFVEFYAPALILFRTENTNGGGIDSYIIKIIGASLQDLETDALKNEDDIDDDSYAVDDGIVKNGQRIRRLLKEISRLKSLTLTCYLAQALAGIKSGLPLPRFAELESLVLSSGYGNCSGGHSKGIIEGLFVLLHSAPVLKSLSIESFFLHDIDSEDDYGYDMMEPVPSCVSHLEEVDFSYYSGKIHVLHLAKYFMENGAQLKKLSLRCGRNEKDEFTSQLLKFPTASTSLIIVCT